MTVQVCLTLPEYLLSSADEKVCYTEEAERFSAFMHDLYRTRRIDRVLLMGSERFQHRVAIMVAEELGIPVLALEEGYIRPGYVTAEWMGNNRSSPIRDLTDQQLLQEPKPKTRLRGSQSRFAVLVLLSTFHYVFRAIGASVFKRHLYHRQRALVREFFLWQRNWMRKLFHSKKNAVLEHRLKTHLAKRFYILPLQVDDDMQLVAAARGWDNRRIAETALKSFARCAPKDHVLVIKVHPFDRGHFADRRRLLRLAKENGIADRFIIIDDGQLGPLTKASCGMVTINSTSGLLALQHGVKLGAAGEAIYSRRSLCFDIKHQDDMDRFWDHNSHVDQRLADGLRFALLNRSLLPGNFYSSSDRQMATLAVASRLVGKVPENISFSRKRGCSSPESTDGSVSLLRRPRRSSDRQLKKVKSW
ncbi:hypothetical protein SLH49_15730 [Cognatiyoonia sp. IB215446]|uniref:capsular polysaccharide export protein, LipB/KpsS family n=1 Tax=Cognatiyoonia sp. IB215446 TaxID=3097355 RepID=UPI002A182524|nr:hypothetical protein [Cognatiyoonia sp. IB215446]MDX8349437.1 hypothetical protein [Cognatiyoonia sp. IB215446]